MWEYRNTAIWLLQKYSFEIRKHLFLSFSRWFRTKAIYGFQICSILSFRSIQMSLMLRTPPPVLIFAYKWMGYLSKCWCATSPLDGVCNESVTLLVTLLTKSNRNVNIATVKCVTRVQCKQEYWQEYGSSEPQTPSLSACGWLYEYTIQYRPWDTISCLFGWGLVCTTWK